MKAVRTLVAVLIVLSFGAQAPDLIARDGGVCSAVATDTIRSVEPASDAQIAAVPVRAVTAFRSEREQRGSASVAVVATGLAVSPFPAGDAPGTPWFFARHSIASAPALGRAPPSSSLNS